MSEAVAEADTPTAFGEASPIAAVATKAHRTTMIDDSTTTRPSTCAPRQKVAINDRLASA